MILWCFYGVFCWSLKSSDNYILKENVFCSCLSLGTNNIWRWVSCTFFIFRWTVSFKAHCGTFKENCLQQKGVFRVWVMWHLLSIASGTSSAHKRPLALSPSLSFSLILSHSHQQSCNQSASLFLPFSLFISLCAVQSVRSLACLIWVNDARARPGLRLQQESRRNSCGQAETAYLSISISPSFFLPAHPDMCAHSSTA